MTIQTFKGVQNQELVLKADYDKLAAEKENLCIECAAAKIAVQYAKAEGFDCILNTPATDAAIAEWKAQGVEEFVSELSGKLRLAGGEDGRSLVYYGEYADHMESKGEDFAAKLRAGKDGE